MNGDSVKVFEQAVLAQTDPVYVLRLYVCGASPKSTAAITNIKKICAEHLAGRCDLRVFDIYQQPRLAADEQVVAAPMLINKPPLPLRRLIGDLSNTRHILQRLGAST